VFDADYDELASAIGKSEAACRQLVHRAREQLREERPRFEVSPDTHRRLLGRFAQALTGGDFSALKAMLADDAELIGDGGGKVPSFGRPMLGAQRIAQLFFAANLRLKDELRIELALINGEWGLLRFFNGVLESAQSFETDGERIVRIHVQRNPDKLVRVAKAFGGC
jgi:RNA polymerase sigma-70 factor (ECF subfamily)